MPVGQKHHRAVPVTPAVALGRVHEVLDLGGGQILAGAELAVGEPFRGPFRGNCSIFGGWRDQPEVRFGHGFSPMPRRDWARSGGLRDPGIDLGTERHEIDWLGQKRLGATLQCLALGVLVAVGGDHDDGHIRA